MASLQSRMDRLHSELANRFLDLGLEVRGPDDAVILRAGGVWDRHLDRYSSRKPKWHVVRVTQAQLKAAKQTAEWLEKFDGDDPDRVALDIYVDLRRGGKTFYAVLMTLVFILRYPVTPLGRTVCWLVTPTYPQQRELQVTIGKILPESWLREGKSLIRYVKSERAYKFPTGAELLIKSADRPEGMKAGGVALIAVNEAQQLAGHAVLHCLGNNIDDGGLTVLAMNPPNTVRGLWAEDLHDAINAVDESGAPVLPFARETEFPASLNEHVNQAARKRFQRLAEIIDPKQAQRDALGLWASIKDRAYPKYDRARHFRPDLLKLLSGWRDVTADLNGLTRYLPLGERREWGIGMDFQQRPYSAAIRAKAFLAPAINSLGFAPGTVVFAVLGERHNDPWMTGEYWSEEELCRLMLCPDCQGEGGCPHPQGWPAASALVIGDGTGLGQGASGRQRGLEADPLTFSFPIVRSYGYEIHAPRERTEYLRGKGRPTEIKITGSNPKVEQRLNTMLEVLDAGRLIIGPDCPETAEAFRRCEARNKRPFGRGAHLTDAVGYLVWKWETCLREVLQDRGDQRLLGAGE